MKFTIDITEFLLEDVSPKTIKKLLLDKYSPEILENTAKKYGFTTIDDLITDVKNRVAFQINVNEKYDPKTQELYKLMIFLIEWKEKYSLNILNYYGIYQAMTNSDNLMRAKRTDEINIILEIAYENSNTTDFALLNGLYKGNDVSLVYENEHCWIYQVLSKKALCKKGIGRDTSWCILNPDRFNEYSKISYFYIVYPKDKKIYEKSSGAYRKFALRLPKEEYAKIVFKPNGIKEVKLEYLIKLRGTKNINENFKTVFNNVTKNINSFINNTVEKSVNYIKNNKDNDKSRYIYVNLFNNILGFYVKDEFDSRVIHDMSFILLNKYEKEGFEEELNKADISDNADLAVKKITTYVLLNCLKLDIIKPLLEFVVQFSNNPKDKNKIIVKDKDIIGSVSIVNFKKVFNTLENAIKIIMNTLFDINYNFKIFFNRRLFNKNFNLEKEIENAIRQLERPIPITKDNLHKFIISTFIDVLSHIKQDLELEQISFIYSIFFEFLNGRSITPSNIEELYNNYINSSENIFGHRSPFEWTNERQYLKYLDFEKFVKDKEHYSIVKDFIEKMYPEYFINNKANEDYEYKLQIVRQFKNELKSSEFIEFFNKMVIKFLESISKYFIQHEIKPLLEDSIKYSEKLSKMVSKVQKFCNIVTSEINYIPKDLVIKDDFYTVMMYLLSGEPIKNSLERIAVQFFLTGLLMSPDEHYISPDIKEIDSNKLNHIEKITFFNTVPEGKIATKLINYYRQTIYDKYKE